MREVQLRLPELALIAMTRGMLGVGIGLLLAGKIPRRKRVPVGWTLSTIGTLSTIPLAIRAFRRRPTHPTNGRSRMRAPEV